MDRACNKLPKQIGILIPGREDFSVWEGVANIAYNSSHFLFTLINYHLFVFFVNYS